MNILQINKFFYLKGGSETVFFQERNFLKSKGHTVIDFSMDDKWNLPSEYSRYFVPNTSYNDIESVVNKIKKAVSFVHSSVAVRKLELLLLQETPQIAHLHNIYHQLTPSIIPILKKYGVKVILTLHDCKLVCPSYLALSNHRICTACSGGNFGRAFTVNCQKSFTRSFLLSAEALFHKWRGSYDGVDLFLAPSRFIADLVSQRVPAEKIKVLHNGVDTDQFMPNYHDKGYGLYFGRLSKEKGVVTLLESHAGMKSSFPLKIVGTGPIAEELKRNYPGVEFTGYQSGHQLADLISSAAFVVVPSECYENCSMVVLEAMAYGKPVIGSRIGGIPEQIEDGITGFLYKMGNQKELVEKMTRLAEDEGLRNRMGRAAREKLVKEYSLGEHNRKLLDTYQRIILHGKTRNGQ